MDSHPNRRQLARELRVAGRSLASIAQELSCSTTAVRNYTRDILVPPAHPRYRTAGVKHDFFAAASLKAHPERLVIVGFVAADGCISEPGIGQSRLIIRLAKKDRIALDRCNEQMADGTRPLHEDRVSVALSFPSDRMCHDLAPYGIVPRKTATMTWPHLVRGEEGRLFLLGYYYGDGCFHRYRNRDVIHFTGTVAFVEGLRSFVYENAVAEHCVVSPIKRTPQYAQCVFQGKHAQRLSAWLFREVPLALLPRKHPPPALAREVRPAKPPPG